MKVSPVVASRETDGRQLVSVQIGDFDLWYRLPEAIPPFISGEFVATAGLLPAMVKGEDLELPASLPLDATFAANLEQLQDVFLHWQESLGLRLSPVKVRADQRATAQAPSADTYSFFSGGVDGTYSAIVNREEITGAILLRGIDMQIGNQELWEQAHAACERMAAHLALPLHAVETNVRFLGYHHGLKWARHFQGAGLASIAHLLAPNRMLIAATSSIADLAPYGSHPLTDPLWSSMATAMVHSAAIPRTDKLRLLAKDEVVLGALRVCWHEAGFNCGKCGKCLRTMVALHLLNAEAPTFPSRIDWREVGRIRLTDPSEWSFFRGLEALERERPDPKARKALRSIRRASLLRSGVRDLDAALTGGILRRIMHKPESE